MTNRKTSASATGNPIPADSAGKFVLGTNLGVRIKNLFRFNSSQNGLYFKDPSFMGSKTELGVVVVGRGKPLLPASCPQSEPTGVLRSPGQSTGFEPTGNAARHV